MKNSTRVKVVLASVFVSVALAAPSIADPSPPTNAGNGAGKSGQCTGSAADRPHGCHAWK